MPLFSQVSEFPHRPDPPIDIIDDVVEVRPNSSRAKMNVATEQIKALPFQV